MDDGQTSEPVQVSGAHLTCGAAEDAPPREGQDHGGCAFVSSKSGKKLRGDVSDPVGGATLPDGSLVEFDTLAAPDDSQWHSFIYFPKGLVLADLDIEMKIKLSGRTVAARTSDEGVTIVEKDGGEVGAEPDLGVDADSGSGDGETGDVLPDGSLFLFVSERTYVPVVDFDSIAAAEAHCVSEAKMAGLPELGWTVILSAENDEARERIFLDDRAIQRVGADATVLWSNAYNLWKNPPHNVAAYDPRGNAIGVNADGDVPVWTGTASDGKLANACGKAWSDAASDARVGDAAEREDTISADPRKCNLSARLYCISQIPMLPPLKPVIQ